MTRAIFTKDHAAMNVAHAGEPYHPSNGFEGELHYEAWCADCHHDAAYRADQNKGAPCDILNRAIFYEPGDAKYPAEWVYGEDGQPVCKAFADIEIPLPEPRCEKTGDLFGGPS